ncbi:serine/threonine-protein kinase [Streptomyces sp. NBC_00878]|uniref:serine/threonine-protein kinase n=1 Tax=Streptomyces sp. NBC_00878 TaxID=2975854 RepID=UPI00224CE44D|nr:serine/threonine-protein kinase [Streptomyces sp. NBC_00878]MCX4908682.1 protein kinase [Streptomyces sp. NBC_00878]
MGVPEITRGGIPGLLVTGRYRLVESIGQGGMGRVWRASDEILDRRVAVKEMRIDGMDQENSRTRRERTLREARATARIDHPNVVRVYDVVDQGERLWIVMELVDGRSLDRVLAEDGPLSPRGTARIGLGLVAALGQVHAGGVLHRDIKPANVLVERRAGRVVLTDFGIAAIQNAEALTMAGMLVGSPDYMAPERVSGRPQGPPSDLWSLGATLCAALGGRSPFARATTLATLHAVLYEEPEIPSAAGELREVLTALLLKDPSMRPGLEELATVLGPVADGSTSTSMGAGAGAGAGTGASAGPATSVGPDSAELIEPARPVGPGEAERTAPGVAAEPGAGAGSGPLPGPEVGPEPPPVTPPTGEGTPRLTEPVEDAVPVGRTPTSRYSPEPEVAAPAEPLSPPSAASPPEEPAPDLLPDPENASSEAPPVGTPEIPSAGAARGHVLHAPGIRPEHPQPQPQPHPRSQPPQQQPEPTANGNNPPPTSPRSTPMPPGEPLGPAVPYDPSRSPSRTRSPSRSRTRSPSQSRTWTWTWSRNRKGAVAAAGVVVAGVVAALVIPALGGSPNGKDEASPSSSSSSGTTGDSPSTPTTPSTPSTALPTVAGTARPPTLPEGSRAEAGMYAWVPPEGWDRVVQSGAEVHYTSPDRKQEILANAAPARGDLMEQWTKTEKDTSKGLDYRRIRLAETTFHDAPAVVWEYTVTAKGLPWHARLLGFNADGKYYEITTWYRPEIESRALPVYTKVKDSFTPL